MQSESKFHYKKDCLEGKEILKKGARATRNTIMAEGTKDSEEEKDEIRAHAYLKK